MVKNYKLALIGLLVSCSLSNAMLRMANLFSRLSRLNNTPISKRYYHPVSTKSERSKPKKKWTVFVPRNPNLATQCDPMYKHYQQETCEKYPVLETVSLVKKKLMYEKLKQIVGNDAFGDDAYRETNISYLLGYETFKLSARRRTKLTKNLAEIYNNTFVERNQEEPDRYVLTRNEIEALNKRKPIIVFSKNNHVGRVGLFEDLDVPLLYERRTEGNEELDGIFKSDKKNKDS